MQKMIPADRLARPDNFVLLRARRMREIREEQGLDDRVLPFDSATAQVAGGLSDLARSRGHSRGFADIAIAATARHHNLMILSRNARHFSSGALKPNFSALLMPRSNATQVMTLEET